ncbi:UNVERIFIED_ORG: Ca2+-binding RTX toxin-like protein [Pseudomonas reinekei]|uniref:type I secretion C-terminal target domain-containing protein n=2 Tax=Pseudomonas laurylsulfatiphila TaxID=2011015 RepID=UPI003D25443B|nr:Ca2+-binding RTX toxin-like protein [Pseudomonas reinekei]
MATLGEIRVNPTTGYHSEPSLTALKDGGYIVAWSDQGTSFTDYIYTQRYNASGVKVGGPALVNNVTNSAQEDPTITALANGGYVVAWQSDTFDDMSDIAAQIYNANGVKVGSEFIVNTTRIGMQDSAEITALSDGGFVVSWSSYGQDGSGWGGYLQRYNASGAKVGVETRVSTTTQYDQDGPTVTGLADGGMMVVWEGNGKDDTAGIFGQRFKADGSKSGAEVRINTSVADDQTDPVVKVLSSGNYVVTWQSAPDDGDGNDETDAPGDIYAQLFNAAGVKMGAETRVNTTTAGNQEEPNVTAMTDGGYLVTWAGQGIGDANGIFSQLFNASGVKVGTETRINTTTTGNQLFSQVTALADGGYVVAWESSVVNGQVDVYTQRFDANGNKVSSLAGDALANTLTWSGAGSVIIDGGAGNDTLTGGRANDHLNGGAGNDSLNGAAGADRLIGGDGSDLYYVDNAGDIVSETNATASTGGTDSVYSFLGAYTLGDNVENLRLLAAGAANGTGNSLNNIIDAGASNNILNGGAGIDTASYAYATAAVTANLSLTTAQATGGSGTDTLLNFENLTGSAYHDTLTGNALANTLTGGAGNDILNGVAGADRMVGGDGSDRYYVDNAGDIVSETNATASTGGTDSVYSFLGAYTLTDNVENLRLLATGNASGTGNSLNNIIDAGVGNNVLNGGAGIDTLSYAYATAAVTANLGLTTAQATGGSGTDTLLNFENLTGSAYHDTLTGNALANTLTGGAGNDTLTGGAGNDLLIGGTGLDKLYGGAGADTFDFNALSEMGLGAALRDVIGDFKTSEGDKIDLSTLDANLATAANDAFSFIGSSAFSSNATGQVRFAGGILYGSTDADTAAEFEIQLLGVSNLQTADLIA